MGLDSFLELFTTMYGWAFAGVIVRVLSDTGLVALPFLFMFLGAWMEVHERGMEAVGWLIAKLEIQIWVAIFVYITCVQPMNLTSLTNATLVYTPAVTTVNPAPATVTGAASNSTFGPAFNDVPNVVAVPPWWYTVMSISSGINSAVRAGISSGMRDFRLIEDIARTATIADPRLREEVQGFYNECFIPARSRYLASETISPQAALAIAPAAFGPGDVDWIGSHAFTDDPGLYPSMYSQRRIPGFPFIAANEPDISPTEPQPTDGRPSCSDWWTDPNVGLRSKMASYVGTISNLQAKVAQILPGAAAEERLDALARLALTKANPNYIRPEATLGDDRSWGNRVGHSVLDVMGVAGSAWEAFKAGAMMMPFITLLTMVQPLILMSIYMFLPLVTVISGYNLQVLVMGAVSIFTVKFWAVMWFIARWLDDHLIEAMYPDANMFLDAFLNADNNYKRMILNILLMLLYIGLPILWTGLMAMAGHRIASGVEFMLNRAFAQATAAGSTGAGLGAKIARGVRGGR